MDTEQCGRVQSSLRIEAVSLTHTGLIRERNEDSVLLQPEQNLYVLADGMGGHEHGDVASRLTVETIGDHFASTDLGKIQSLHRHRQRHSDPHVRCLFDAIERAHETVGLRGIQSGESRRMGSTVVALHFFDALALLAHVGDSRCYRFREGTLEQLTEDHSVVIEVEAPAGPSSTPDDRQCCLQTVLSQAIGFDSGPGMGATISVTRAMPGDLYLLSSDGLHEAVEREWIAEVMATTQELNIICERLVELALERGGADNISVVVARYVDGPQNHVDEVWGEDTQPHPEEPSSNHS